MSDQYNYGPPVTQNPTGTPAVTTGATTVAGTSGAAAGATGTTNVAGGGGSASEESGQNVAYQSTVASTSPATSVGATPTTVTVTGTKFTPRSVIQLAGVNLPTTYVSDTQLRASFTGTAGAKTVKVQTGSYVSTTSASYTFT